MNGMTIEIAMVLFVRGDMAMTLVGNHCAWATFVCEPGEMSVQRQRGELNVASLHAQFCKVTTNTDMVCTSH